jgi:uncharacterized membrane protein
LSIPVIVPDAVSEHEVGALLLAVAVVESSFLAHDPISATVPTSKTIQNSNFFIITSFITHFRKMQGYSYILLSVMVLTNTGITPSTHNLKQLK